jgi:hypothetical protein
MENKEQSKTIQEMCEDIAKAWNDDRGEPKLEWTDIIDNRSISMFPALHLPRIHDAAINGVLTGLLLSDETSAKIFCQIVLSVGEL